MNTGIDILEIDRIHRSIQNPRFAARVFSKAELELFSERGFNPATVAGNFCAKEAFSKAVGTGIRGYSLREVSILRDAAGAPYIRLEGQAEKLFGEKLRKAQLSVSISHSRALATAIVIIL